MSSKKDNGCNLDPRQLEVLGIDQDDYLRAVNAGTITSWLRKRKLEVEDRARQLKIQASAASDLEEVMGRHPRDSVEGLKSILRQDHRGESGYMSVDVRQNALVGWAHSQVAGLLERFRPRMLGFAQDKEGLRNVVRELFGNSSGDPDAAAFAGMWRELTDKMIQRFQRAGGRLTTLKEWNLPQTHDPLRIIKAGKNEWVSFIKPLLDRAKVTDELGVRMDDARFTKALEAIYDGISTDGASRAAEAVKGVRGSRAIANRRGHHRFLHFTDAESWLKYQDRFGQGDVFTTMTDHIDSLARDTAIVEAMGPNPTATYDQLRARAVADMKGSTGGLEHADSMFKLLSGQLGPRSERMADIFASLRNLEVATHLGSATLSAITDPVFTVLTSIYRDLSVMKVAQRMLRGLNPLNVEDRITASRIGLVAEYAIDRATAANRYAEIVGYNWTARLSDFTMRASGLNIWTLAGKQAFGVEFIANLTEQLGKSWKELTPGLREALNAYGIDSEEWKQMAKARTFESRGVKLLEVSKLPNELSAKIIGMVYGERRYAVPEPDASVKAVLNQGLPRGTVAGELIRSATQFKSFPVTVLMSHWSRALAPNTRNRAMYAASLFTGTTALGALAFAAKEISKGREPPDMDSPRFALNALAQGGGAGVLGDFLFSDTERFGNSLTSTLAGPLAGDIDALAVDYLLGNTHRGLAGEREFLSKLGGSTAFVAERYIPGQLWYTRLLMERALTDNLGKLIDPKWEVKEKRKMRARMRDHGQGYWWAPGDPLPRG